MGGDLDSLLAYTEPVSLAADLTRRVRTFRGIGGAKAAEQIVTAAESIVANVAEGYGRGPGPDGARILRYARGSANELQGHIVTSTNADRFTAEEGAGYLQRISRIRALVHGLLKRFETVGKP